MRAACRWLRFRIRSDGPAFDIGERVVSRAMRAFGVRSLDTFVLTHGDPDHMGGARAVVRSFRPRADLGGRAGASARPLRRLAEAADSIGAEWRTVRAGDRLRIATVEIVALHPPAPEWERQRVRNDDSIVLAVRMGQVSVILPGDIGREGERRALEHLEAAPLTVLKAPHHGSATSSTREFLEAIEASGRDRQRRTKQPLRPSRAGGRRALSRHGRADVLDC